MALNTMTQQLGLGNLAHHFDGEDTTQWAVLIPEVRILRNGRSVGSIEVTDSLSNGLPSLNLYIVIPDVYHLIRDKHISEFEPTQYGLHVNHAKNWLGEKEADIIVEWTVSLDEVRQGPSRVYKNQNHSPATRVKVKPSL